MRAGWAAGAGAEAAIGQGWSVKAEYLHLDFGNIDQSVSGTGGFSLPIGNLVVNTTIALAASSHARITDDVFRVGVNYKFGWAGL